MNFGEFHEVSWKLRGFLDLAGEDEVDMLGSHETIV